MNDTSPSRIASSKFVALAGAVLVASLISGAAFAGWTAHGSDIFVALAASGLSWCF